ncbi:hypothetical protein HDU98_003003 [Podochytrium sp. JEL0797]|nr:hypothetical protein HDU98_003003 [Podochytrium sp. JEL0797]
MNPGPTTPDPTTPDPNPTRLDRKSLHLLTFPTPLLQYAHCLETLDLSGNPHLSTLPDSFSTLHHLRVSFFSDCGFTTFPSILAQCPSLEMIAFRANGMNCIPEDSFPPRLRWLILTGNKLTHLPHSISKCTQLEKLMLVGNQLTHLPQEMESCFRLALVRVSANALREVPAWLVRMPRVAFLAVAGNPGTLGTLRGVEEGLEEVEWMDVGVSKLLGEGASGVILQATWKGREVAVKLFKGQITSDGLPRDEMDACIAAGTHSNLITAIGTIVGHPYGTAGLVLPLVGSEFRNLGLTPSFESCTRDVYPAGMKLSGEVVVRILGDVAGACVYLHGRGISHGDLYAHNILVDDSGNAMFGDFGAAFVYGRENVDARLWERVEVLAFGHLVEDMIRLISDSAGRVVEGLHALHAKCVLSSVDARPDFREVQNVLEVISSLISLE